MFIQAITLFPEMFSSITEYGVTGRAFKQNLWQFAAINPRQFADNKLGYIDDRPFGGGPGMIMMAPPIQAAIDAAKAQSATPNHRVIYLSPQGAPLTHQKVLSLSQYDSLILLCGRYEGIDERVLMHSVDEEISIGDFVVDGCCVAFCARCVGRHGFGRARFVCQWFIRLPALHASHRISGHERSRGFKIGQSCADSGMAVGTIAAPHFATPSRAFGRALFTPTGSPSLG